jgi:hypothetical protein
MFSMAYSLPSSQLSHLSRIFVSKPANLRYFLKSAGRDQISRSRPFRRINNLQMAGQYLNEAKAWQPGFEHGPAF